MIVPPWLDAVLARNESLCLDNADDRAKLAAAILRAIPSDALIIASGASAARVLKQHGIADGAQIIATKIARRAAKNILLALEAG